MRIAVIGPGGVGGYFGGRLAASGCDVTFVARGAHLEAMQKDGLRVLSPLGDLCLQPVKATQDTAAIGQVDLVMIAVKLWSLEEALHGARPLIGADTAVVSFQNGVEAVPKLVTALGRDHVLGGVAHIAAVIEGPGVIRHNGKLQKLMFGELDGSRSPRTERFLKACTDAGIDAILSHDIERAIWNKFVFLVGLSGMTALTRLPIGPVREDPDTRLMLFEVMREAAEVGRAKGFKLPPETAERQFSLCDGLPYGMVSSMLGDLNRGNRLELPWLSGAVARLGHETGVDTPVNRFITTALKLHAEGRRPASG